MGYLYYNPNPAKLKGTGDCAVRALAIATMRQWEGVFADLCQLGSEATRMPNDMKVVAIYLEARGFTPQKVQTTPHRPTVRSFANDHPEGRFVLRCAHHVVAVVDGIYVDTFDSGYKSVYRYWAKEGS